MANDYVYIVCRECNVGLTLLKSYGVWGTSNSVDNGLLQPFVDEHSFHGGDQPFSFCYEINDSGDFTLITREDAERMSKTASKTNEQARACLHCGGTGCKNNTINNAGDFYRTHCERCGGIGKEDPVLLVAKMLEDEEKVKVEAAQREDRKAKRRALYRKILLFEW